MFHVLYYSLLPDRLLDSPLSLEVKGIRVHGFDRGLRLYLPRPRLAEQFREPCGVVLGRTCNLGLGLGGGCG